MKDFAVGVENMVNRVEDLPGELQIAKKAPQGMLCSSIHYKATPRLNASENEELQVLR